MASAFMGCDDILWVGLPSLPLTYRREFILRSMNGVNLYFRYMHLGYGLELEIP